METIEKPKLKLPNVTLAAMTSVKIYETIKALEYSMQGIEFGEVVLITHRKPFGLPKGITYKHTSKLTDIDCFNYKMVYELGDYIQTDYMLFVHYDGFYNEDIFLCCMNKHKIEEAGMKIAPVEVAKYFGHEHPVPETEDVDAPFVFHKWWGKNVNYSRFENPWTRRWLRFKDMVRPLLFWRRLGG